MMIDLYTAATPNGQTISIALEELVEKYPGLKYTTKSVNLQEEDQKGPEFLKINPNGRIPAIVDHYRSPSFSVFESGAVFEYLIEHYDKGNYFSFREEDWQLRSELQQWLFFQNAGVGPMQGQSNHFFRYAADKHPYSIDRYQNETKRLYQVLEDRLAENGEWLVGNKYTFADVTNFTWVRWAPWAGIKMDTFIKLTQWAKRIEERPAVQKGLLVPNGDDTIVKLRNGMEGDEWGEWVRKSQKDLADKDK